MRPLTPLLLAAPLCALTLAGCGTATSTSGFSGGEHEVAQTIANFQSAATAGEGSKICADYLSSDIVAKLGGHSGCETAIKHQLAQVDNLELTIAGIKLAPDGRSATATVKGTHYGKKAIEPLALVKEGSSWKLSGP